MGEQNNSHITNPLVNYSMLLVGERYILLVIQKIMPSRYAAVEEQILMT